MRDIKIGHKQGGFVNANSVAYMYYKSKTIFFKAQYCRLLSGYWFHQSIETFCEAISHETIHMVLLRRFGKKVCRRLDKVLGQIGDIRV